MKSSWLDNDDARHRVSDLLNQAGIPLELTVASTCQEFAHQHAGRDYVSVETSKIVYSTSNEPESYREVDQSVQIYDEFEVGPNTGIQLIGNVPIECKHRNDVEYFAFPVVGETTCEGFPVCSTMAGSEYFRSLRGAAVVLQKLCPASVTMIKIKDSDTPQSVHTESVLYNGASALYDFVFTDLCSLTPLGLSAREEQQLTESGVFSRFERYISENRYGWWTVLRSQIQALSMEECRSFNKAIFSGGRVYQTVCLHMPVLCVDGPLYRVEWDASSGVSDFVEAESCLVSIRKQQWPGETRFSLLRRTPEVPVVLTNSAGLQTCLELAEAWYEKTRSMLKSASKTVVERWPLETALYSKALSHYTEFKKQDGYRSDLDMESCL